MAFTPAHLASARGSYKSSLLSPPELIRIRKLYLEKRYKQCIAACDESLGLDLHTIHKVFLLFQQAISYEALGAAAHNYSRNKIPFLECADEKFREAYDLLPQPFVTHEHGQYQTPGPSPLVAPFDHAETASENQALIYQETPTPVLQILETDEDSLSDSCGEYSNSPSTYSIAYSAPNFDKYSPRPEILGAPGGIPRTVTFPDVDQQDPNSDSDSTEDGTNSSEDTLTARDSKLLSRLSASLSSTHVLADDLVPSPLFSRTKKTATISFPSLDTSTTPVSTATIRPPPSAYYANGADHNLLSVRKTAVVTLISKFENTLPTPTSILSPRTPISNYTDATLPPTPLTTNAFDSTATTARFALIHSIFNPHPPATNTYSQLTTYLTTRSLARYNAALASFNTSLLSSLCYTERAIGSARRLQEQHAEEKRKAFLASSGEAGKRMASYWLLSSPIPTPTPTPKPAMGLPAGGEKSGRGRRVGVVERACWGARKPPGGVQPRPQSKTSAPDAVEDATTRQKKQERMEKLRQRGFRVRKENFGWKGGEYYDELRHNAERDLIMAV